MSRVIKFRGLNNETNEFVYGYYTKLIEDIRKFDAIISDIGGELVRFYIHDSKTIGQYIGEKDKNGKDVYEGDIIQPIGTERIIIVKYSENFNVSNYYWKIIGFAIPDGIDRFTGNPCFEVIGNIHQNPELLNSKELTK